ncbi:ABC transporter substrate-binding protein [Streptomyces lomondensis]|uniref:Sugar-binding protein n=1 Tax=Streptomyces lomondensis TaxID=68229 RepID=A0ABQ2XJN2_9ACTN|nr:sugar ABC transporter substrate-binding protein [Streptomyces lomondensis]MCF0079649.1 sugar ABC transporter substrate-binding protein [Streptomyces lomondensis]GGX19515.1 sugar-binding protein [Streptomyces lomondensis]
MVFRTRRLAVASVAALAATALVAGCATGSGGSSTSGAKGDTLTLWTHNAGNSAELDVVKKIIKDFNGSQSTYKVELQAFPQSDYNNSVVAAASARKLPCLLDVDGPNVPNWAWGGYLAPIDVSGSEVPLSAQLPSTVGRYQGKVYAFGFYDVSLAFFARKSVLKEYGIRIPTLDKPWTKAEFDSALAKLKKSGKFPYPLEMGTGSLGEWYPYAYSPQLQSFGGDLIDRDGYQTASGTLDGKDAVEWATWFRSLVAKGYLSKKSGADPNKDFLAGKSALQWDGSWNAAKNAAKLGDDLAIIPPVDFGHGPKIGGASWQWAMSSTCSNKAGAQAWLKFARQTKYFVDYAEATGTIPATDAAAQQVDGYQPGGKFSVFTRFAREYAVVRPVTPAYPYISTEFQKAVQDILAGADPEKALGQATKDIDTNLKTNRY